MASTSDRWRIAGVSDVAVEDDDEVVVGELVEVLVGGDVVRLPVAGLVRGHAEPAHPPRRHPLPVEGHQRITGHCRRTSCGHVLVTAGQELLDTHVRGASKLYTGDGWRYTRRGEGHCDAAYSAAGAVSVLLTMPKPNRGTIRSFAA